MEGNHLMLNKRHSCRLSLMSHNEEIEPSSKRTGRILDKYMCAILCNNLVCLLCCCELHLPHQDYIRLRGFTFATRRLNTSAVFHCIPRSLSLSALILAKSERFH
jgi:hypothetical protein